MAGVWTPWIPPGYATVLRNVDADLFCLLSIVTRATLARLLAMALCPSVCVCLSQVGALSKGMND